MQIKTSQRLNPGSRYQFHNGRIQPVDILQGKRAITHAWLEAEIVKRAEAGGYQQLNPKIERPYLLAPDPHLTLALQSALFRSDTWQLDQQFENNLVVFPVTADCQNPPLANNPESNAHDAMLHDHDYCGADRMAAEALLALGATSDDTTVSVTSRDEVTPELLQGGENQGAAGHAAGIADPYGELSNIDWLGDEGFVENAKEGTKKMEAAEGLVELTGYSYSVQARMELEPESLLDIKQKARFDKDKKDASEDLLKFRKKKE